MFYHNIEYIAQFVSCQDCDLFELELDGCLNIIQRMSNAPESAEGICRALRETILMKQAVLDYDCVLGSAYVSLIRYMTEWLEPI